MKAIQQFTLETHDGPYETWPERSKLLSDGVWTGTKVPGYVIEAQFSVGSRYLIITSYDYPLEEANHILLLDQDCRILSTKYVGVWYYTFLFKSAEPVADNQLLLTFEGEMLWRMLLTVRDKRRFLLGSYLTLSRAPT